MDIPTPQPEVMLTCTCCNKEYSVGTNPNGNTLSRKYCSRQCSDNANHQRSRRVRKYDPERRRKEWEATKARPDKLALKQEQDRRANTKVRTWLQEYKLSMGCIDCGYKEHYSALQLDHQGFKSISISDARSSVARIKQEIEEGNCVVRCANCHSIITWKRKMGLV